MSLFVIIITRWLLFFRKLAGKLQRCWSVLVTEEDHPQPQTQRLDSVLPSLFEVDDVIMFFDKTWRQHIDVANQLLDSGVDVNSLYQRNNIFDNLLYLLVEHELEDPNWCKTEMVQAIKRLILRVIRAGIDLNHRSRDGDLPIDWYYLFCRNSDLIDILKELVIHGANLDVRHNLGPDPDPYPEEEGTVRELMRKEWPEKYQDLMQFQGRVLAHYVKDKVGIGYRTYELLLQPAGHIITEADIRCPISLDMMRDPVVGSDGHSYERSSLLSYVAYRDKRNLPLRSPMNPSELLNRDIMISNHHLKSLVSEFKLKN
jgi:hypothetical protein